MKLIGGIFCGILCLTGVGQIVQGQTDVMSITLAACFGLGAFILLVGWWQDR
ncbi:MAG: hypothetical protein H6822_33205 [Planctomycetaceae bacterium]|nr:hypothetical protein [Planctomycetales bacterium]MCB9927045.1 hypothetical protein [Planctomycetaceae bacterium]